MLDSERFATLRARGFEPLRYGHMMIRPHLRDIPTGPLPPGVEIRPVTADQLRTIFDADNVAFRDHWGNVDQTEDDYLVFVGGARRAPGHRCGRSRGPATRSSARCARTPTTATGRCSGASGPGRRTSRPPGRGASRGSPPPSSAPASASSPTLGYEEAALGVDTENLSGALGLYESLGYTVVATDAMLHRPITLTIPGRALAHSVMTEWARGGGDPPGGRSTADPLDRCAGEVRRRRAASAGADRLDDRIRVDRRPPPGCTSRCRWGTPALPVLPT